MNKFTRFFFALALMLLLFTAFRQIPPARAAVIVPAETAAAAPNDLRANSARQPSIRFENPRLESHARSASADFAASSNTHPRFRVEYFTSRTKFAAGMFSVFENFRATGDLSQVENYFYYPLAEPSITTLSRKQANHFDLPPNLTVSGKFPANKLPAG